MRSRCKNSRPTFFQTHVEQKYRMVGGLKILRVTLKPNLGKIAHLKAVISWVERSSYLHFFQRFLPKSTKACCVTHTLVEETPSRFWLSFPIIQLFNGHILPNATTGTYLSCCISCDTSPHSAVIVLYCSPEIVAAFVAAGACGKCTTKAPGCTNSFNLSCNAKCIMCVALFRV
jgi:hypothetical protein